LRSRSDDGLRDTRVLGIERAACRCAHAGYSLNAAFNLLRGVTVNANAPTMAKRAVPN
jgi:hypothetical protein